MISPGIHRKADHNHFQSPGSTVRYARKELRSEDSRLMNYEIKNLNLVKRIQDPHLVRIIKAYKHGDKGNIVFPLAKTNLDCLLRDPSFRASKTLFEGIVWHPFWMQVLNITRALHKVLDYEIHNPTRNDVLYGYHLDLKPTNILVEEPWTFVIADFGQACFKTQSEATSSKVRGFGGTESYAPPEADNVVGEQNRRYDIWSLGCVVLEICAFIVFGYSGVNFLDQARLTTTPDGNSMDDRFFERGIDTHHRIKTAVDEWMVRLLELPVDDNTREFLRAIIGLIRKMLEVEVSRRSTSREVCAELASILDQRPKSRERQPSTSTVDFACESSQIEISHASERVQELWYNIQGYWEQGPVRLVDQKGCLWIQIWKHGSWHSRSIGSRMKLKAVLQYALPINERHHYSESSLYLSPVTGSQPARGIHNEKFWSQNLNDIFSLQKALLGNEVTHSVPLEKALPVFSKQHTKLRQRFFGLSTDDNLRELEHVKCLQLWTEVIDHELHSPTDTAHGTPNSTFPHYGPRRRRLVFFRSTSILVLNLSDNIRLLPISISEESSTSIAIFEPIRRSIRPRIMGYILEKHHDEHSPGLLLDKKSLDWEEQSNHCELDSLKIIFRCGAEMQSFVQAYRRFKFFWTRDHEKYLALKGSIGPTLGFERL